MSNLDERISAALHAAVDGIQEQALRPADPPADVASGRRPVRWIAPLLAAASVVVAAAVTVAVTNSPSASRKAPIGGGTPPPSHSATVTPIPDEIRGLWPFTTRAEAYQWQTVDGPNGHSPWHADAEATALFFASGYLQFHDITVVTSSDIRGDTADIGVGYDAATEGGKHTASVVHLVRVGDENGPWQVVGATSEHFSVTEPLGGSHVTSPMIVSGLITGVDESIAVTLRALDGAGVNHIDPVPAGGDDAPWAVTVPFSLHGGLALVASTGGHLVDHERFVVIGVVSPAS